MGKNVNINAKNTGDKLTASEFNQVLDALNGDFSELSGTTWDGTNKYTTLTANTALTLTTTRNNGILKVVQDGTGSRTLTVNGQSLTIGTAASAVSFVYFINVAGTNHLFVELPAGSTAGAEPGNITPAAPTAGTVNDTLDTFDFTYTPGYTTVSEYEYTLDGGTTVSDLTAKPLAVGNIAKAAGQVGVRVKAATGRNASAWLFNAQPFTVTASYDTDAQAAFTAIETAEGSSLSSVVKTAYNDWVVREKAASRYTKYKAIYPFLGASAGAHAINAKVPGTNNLTFNGSGWTHTAAGIKSNKSAGTNADTGIKPNVMPQDSNFIMVVLGEAIDDGYPMGAYESGGGSLDIGLIGGVAYTFNNSSANGTTSLTSGDPKGPHIVSRVDAAGFTYANKFGANSITAASVGRSASNILIGDVGGLTGNGNSSRLSFAAIGDTGFSSAEATAAITSINQLITDLSR